MSPRYRPRPKEPSIAQVAPQQPDPWWRDPPDVAASEAKRERDYLSRLARASADNPYPEGGAHSFFADLLALERARRRQDGTIDSPRFGRGDPGPAPGDEPFGSPSPEAARRRLAAQQRDLTSQTGSAPDALRPSMPRRLAEVFGKAARRTSGLIDALPSIPLERGMVDTTGSQLVIRIPALTTGATVAAQAENAAVQESDPVSAGIAAPLGSIAGQVDASRQLIDFSNPRMDEVLADDLGARLGEALDGQLFQGSGSAPNLRGFLQWASILSVTGSITNQTAYLQSLWQAFSLAAGSGGYGDADRANFLTLIHPRRFAWLQAGFSTPIAAALPGTVVLVPNAPANLGGGTNEDWTLVIDRSAVQLIAGSPQVRAFEEVGSSTQTIRFSAHLDAALAVLNVKAICKVTGGTPPSGF